MKQYISEYQSYSFLTKSAKLKLAKRKGKVMDGYSFLTKSAKLKPEADLWRIEFGYSFLTKSAKLKLLSVSS